MSYGFGLVLGFEAQVLELKRIREKLDFYETGNYAN